MSWDLLQSVQLLNDGQLRTMVYFKLMMVKCSLIYNDSEMLVELTLCPYVAAALGSLPPPKIVQNVEKCEFYYQSK